MRAEHDAALSKNIDTILYYERILFAHCSRFLTSIPVSFRLILKSAIHDFSIHYAQKSCENA